MADLSPQSRNVLDRFAQQPDVTPDQVLTLRRVIIGSPALSDQFNAAVAAGHVQRFSLLPAGTNAGGTYDGIEKTINLPARILSPASGSGSYGAAELTFVLGHELQHGFNHAATSAAYTLFDEEVRGAATGNHDYTDAIGNLISANRRDEASAQLAGWNALVGMVRTENPDASLRDVFDASPRTRDFLTLDPGTGAAVQRPQLTFATDNTLSASSANIEAMGRIYFDKPPQQSALGHHGNSDYANYYGAYAVGVASRLEASRAVEGEPPQMKLDMNRLGLQESIMEQNGIWLGPDAPSPQPYFDTSTTPPSLHYFDHTHSTHTHIPITAQEHERLRISNDNITQTHPSGPPAALSRGDENLHAQIRHKVAELDAANGRTFDETSERLSASLLVVARQNGLQQVDHVVLSKPTIELPAAYNIFLVQGDPADPASLRASMPTALAAQQSLQQSTEALEAVNRVRADNLAQDQSRDQQQAFDQQRVAMPGP